MNESNEFQNPNTARNPNAGHEMGPLNDNQQYEVLSDNSGFVLSVPI